MKPITFRIFTLWLALVGVLPLFGQRLPLSSTNIVLEDAFNPLAVAPVGSVSIQQTNGQPYYVDAAGNHVLWGAGGSNNWINLGTTDSTLSGIALIGTNAPPTGLSNTNTTVLWINGGIGFNTNVIDGPAWGTNGAGMIYRHTGELAIDPGFVFRGHGYVFEDDATNWKLLITTNGVNVGQIHSATYMPLNMLEVGSDVGGPPCGFLVGNDFVGKSNAPPNGVMIEGALKVYGDIYADVYRDAAGNVLLYNNIGGGYLELGQQTGSQEIHFWSFGADQMHLNSAGTLVMQGLNTIQTYGGITTPLISGPTNLTLRANGTNWWLVSEAGTLLGLTGTETINAGGGGSFGLVNATNRVTTEELQLKKTAGGGRVGQTPALVTGTNVVSNTNVTANSIIFLTHGTSTGTLGILAVTNIVAETSFEVMSSSSADTNVINWLIIEPY